jgi:tRNA U34 5-methylaminomethyl-2-thiouridine-forming methyltransferase MnmC
VALTGFKIVQFANGARGIHSLAFGETMHPAIGPAAEGVALYVTQLRLLERIRKHAGEFVVWDIGLGAAANALAVLRATRHLACPIRLFSFDDTTEALRFALNHAEALGYFGGYESHAQTLLEMHRVNFQDAEHRVEWELQPGDFPSVLARWLAEAPARIADAPSHTRPLPAKEQQSVRALSVPLRGGVRGGFRVAMRREQQLTAGDTPIQEAEQRTAGRRETRPTPQAILFDPFSPAKNPAMWTLPMLTNLFRLLDPARPCALATYSRSTMTRAALLLAGFYVGAGQATGAKEETTLAANRLELIDEPLDRRWLERARRSHSAEPLGEPVYRQARLAAATWEGLQAHPQFR